MVGFVAYIQHDYCYLLLPPSLLPLSSHPLSLFPPLPLSPSPSLLLSPSPPLPLPLSPLPLSPSPSLPLFPPLLLSSPPSSSTPAPLPPPILPRLEEQCLVRSGLVKLLDRLCSLVDSQKPLEVGGEEDDAMHRVTSLAWAAFQVLADHCVSWETQNSGVVSSGLAQQVREWTQSCKLYPKINCNFLALHSVSIPTRSHSRTPV